MATNQVERATSVAKDTLKSAPKTADSVMDRAQDLADQGLEYFNDGFGSIRSGAKNAVSSTESLIKENPFYAVSGAVAIGALLGVWLARPRR